MAEDDERARESRECVPFIAHSIHWSRGDCFTAGSSAQIYGPLLIWHPDAKDPKTVLKADIKFLNNDPRKRPARSERKSPDGVATEAICAENGASINFQLVGERDTQGSQFDWHEDPAMPDEGVVDVKVTIDGTAHAAKGFLLLEGDNQYVNHMGLLFYEPGLPVRARRQTEFGLRTGTPLDNIFGGLLNDSSQAQADDGVRTSAGPLRDLVSARSIKFEFPIREGQYSATLELNPQDAVMHDFATRCYERFVTTKAPAAPAQPPPTPSRQRPAGSPSARTR